MRTCFFVFLALLVGGAAGTAVAQGGQDSGPIIDVSDEFLHSLNSSFSSQSGLLSGIRLKNAILEDNEVDRAEAMVLDSILSGEPSFVVRSGEKTHTLRSNLDNAGLNILRSISYDHFDLVDLFSQGSDGYKEMTALYMRSDVEAKRVVNFLTGKAGEVQSESNAQNAWAPLRAFVTTGFAGIDTLPPDAKTAGRRMLHDAVKGADTEEDGSDGPVPNILYAWLVL